jgi:AraC-like DNA-binding protein
MKSKELVKLWRTPSLPQLELMRATYVTQTFPRHAHECFAIGVIETGALGFRYRGADVVAPAGAVNLANPGEPHTGQAAVPQGWSYRMFYLDPAVLNGVARQMADKPVDFPFFPDGVIHDSAMADRLQGLHRLLECDGSDPLEAQSGLLEMLILLIARHADAAPRGRPAGKEPQAVRRVRDYIAVHYGQSLSVDRLASEAGLSPFHFMRVFRRTVGLSPHAYLTQVRVRRAKDLIARGENLAATAIAVGFGDQSHLNRHFKRLTGFTPGYYRRIVQDDT